MPLHYTNELIFDLPEPLIDMTHHVFSLREDGPSEFNMVISQHKIDRDESLEVYGSRLAVEMEKTLPNCQVHSHGSSVVAGQEALWLIYSWVQQGQRLHQAQVNFFHNKDQENRQLIQITATALGKFTDEWKHTFETFLASIRLRQEPTPADQK